MEENVKFSVVTICYNAKNELSRTLDSLWAQAYPSYESVVIDGGSADGTADFIRKEKRIARYVSEPDNGVYDAMNKGLRLCRGDFVIFMNAGDEFFNPYVLETAAAVLRKYPCCRFLYGDACMVREDGSTYFREYDKPVTLDNICHQSIFYDRKLFEEFGGYDTDFAIVADYDFNLRIIAEGGVVPYHFSRPVCYFYEGGLSSGAKFAEKQRKDSALLREKQGEREKLAVPETVWADVDVDGSGVLKRWQAQNAGFKRRLAYRLGDSAGLFSEINNMLFAMVWAFDNKVRFELCSQKSNLGDGGWNDFFEPFTQERCSDFLLGYNRRYAGERRGEKDRAGNMGRREIEAAKKKEGTDFLTQDIFRAFFENAAFAEKTFDFRKLGLYGNSFAAAGGLARAVYRLNAATRADIRHLTETGLTEVRHGGRSGGVTARAAELPEDYIAVQMRAGDITKESAWRRQGLLGAAPYAEKIRGSGAAARNVFVFADDFRLVAELAGQLPEYRIFTLCAEGEKGFDYEAFMRLSAEERRKGIVKILANVEICRSSRRFIGTRVSNPSWFLRLIMPEDRVSFVDCQRLRWQLQFDAAADGGAAQVLSLFGVPLLKIVRRGNKVRIKLFSVLPLLKIIRGENAVRVKLFSFLPLFELKRAG